MVRSTDLSQLHTKQIHCDGIMDDEAVESKKRWKGEILSLAMIYKPRPTSMAGISDAMSSFLSKDNADWVIRADDA